MSNGKGDRYRPVDQKVYGENYDRIFRRTNDEAPKQAADKTDPSSKGWCWLCYGTNHQHAGWCDYGNGEINSQTTNSEAVAGRGPCPKDVRDRTVDGGQ